MTDYSRWANAEIHAEMRRLLEELERRAGGRVVREGNHTYYYPETGHAADLFKAVVKSLDDETPHLP